MSEADKKDFINVEEVIQSKNPRLLTFLPGFVINYLKRILHQEFINDFIRRNGDKTSFNFVEEILKEFGPNVTWEGLEHIPENGGAIIAANHPIGGLDAMALLHVIAKKRKDQQFIVNDVLLSIKNLNELFVGVNKHGKNKTEVLDKIDSYYSSENLVLIFPAGLVSRKQKKGVIRDLEWKKSFITKAKKFNRNIIPVHISGRNSNFFYNLARLRNFIGLKVNIEMFYLMDEMYNQNGKTIHVKIGKPLPATFFTNQYSDLIWAQKVKDHVYALEDNSSNLLIH